IVIIMFFFLSTTSSYAEPLIVQTRSALSALSGRVELRSNGLSAIALRALTINPLDLTKSSIRFQSPPELERI
ncbi:hypothetical protein J7J63_00335, partial [Candidatus Bipolaricaulota bacterium]|nr:hypothetical protein [Candidatus Bipolaricaulota bacterium]